MRRFLLTDPNDALKSPHNLAWSMDSGTEEIESHGFIQTYLEIKKKKKIYHEYLISVSALL